MCVLLLLADLPVSARSSKKHKALARSSKKRKARSSANEHKALVKCAGLWAEQRNVVGGFYFEEIFHGFEGQKRSFK